jgi:hypothetical protein
MNTDNSSNNGNLYCHFQLIRDSTTESNQSSIITREEGWMTQTHRAKFSTIDHDGYDGGSYYARITKTTTTCTPKKRRGRFALGRSIVYVATQEEIFESEQQQD